MAVPLVTFGITQVCALARWCGCQKGTRVRNPSGVLSMTCGKEHASQMERQGAKQAKNATGRSFLSEPPPELDELARDVIGAAIEVHRQLGPGFLEGVYEDALALELFARRIPFARQVTLPVHYKGTRITDARLDMLVSEVLVVELKAVEELRPIHVAQTVSYLRAGEFQLGLLFNFNVYALRQGIRRIVSSG